MTSTDERPSATAAYGLAKPTCAELRRAVARIFGDDVDAVWRSICDAAHVAADPRDDDLDALLDAMQRHGDPAVRLCAESMLIRVRTFQHLSQADHFVRSAS